MEPTAPRELSTRLRPPAGAIPLTHSQIHVVPLSQCPQPVQAPTLVVILQELHKACKESMAAVRSCPGITFQPQHHPTKGPRELPGELRAVSSYSQVSHVLQSSAGTLSTWRSVPVPAHLLWYMEKERNWFLNIWYMSPSGLWRDGAGWGTWGWEGTASPACPTAQAAPPWDRGH